MSSAKDQDLCSGPWPLITLPSYPFIGNIYEDFAEHIAGDMTVVHNTIIRSINSIWHHAPTVSPKDISAYANYVLVALSLIDTHHHTEEAFIFPVLEKAGLRDMVDENIGQHKAFHDAMEVLVGYLKGVVAGKETYEWQRMRKLVKEFADPLVQHLHDEITTIQPETMHKVDKEEYTVMNRKLDAHIQAQGGLFTVVPFVLTAHKKDDAPFWPPFPGPAKWLVQNVFYHAHSSYWKFAPYSRTGEPQGPAAVHQ